MSDLRVLVLGGYGNFGKRICARLARHGTVHLYVAGRNVESAEKLCRQLRGEGAMASLTAIALDITSAHFPHTLKALAPFLVIHTSGPFQHQDYRVPKACIEAGAHYIDLADDRRFVCDIGALDADAKAKQLSIVSGASSVPGLSSVVVDHFRSSFSQLDELDIAIAPGNKAERGEATVKGILSYTGHPVRVFENGHWALKYGWMSPRKLSFGSEVGTRLLANVDVPDLELFPTRYAPVQTVTFQAGLELPFLHWGMVAMAWLAKKRIVKNWAPLVKPIVAAINWFIHFGSDTGGMRIQMVGRDSQQKPLEIVWQLTARNGVGPFIPTLSAVILAEKLLQHQPLKVGAFPCLGLYSLDEFSTYASEWGIYHQTFINGQLLNG